jgi:hypothetical protein
MENEKYTTKDLYLTTFLIAVGKDLQLEREGGDNRFVFIFEKDGDIEDLTDKFYQRKATVDPMEFCIAMKQLKSRMYNFR